MKKQLLLLILLAILIPRSYVKADEGMWLPFMIDDALFSEMQEMGLNLTRDQIFSFTESSLKDAIVHFGGGCTAEIISDMGLVLTNHHCGYGRIQALSSVENDLLTNGFWADELGDELPSQGLFVRFLVQARDVTEEVAAALSPDLTEEERGRIIREKSEEIVAAATDGTHYTANVRPMFAGNEFFLFVYETYNDVRLVGTPPESIGSYGGDTDNWMW
ncbi:MAG: S46 family peptidase, partial [Bacteroidales bacterium]